MRGVSSVSASSNAWLLGSRVQSVASAPVDKYMEREVVANVEMKPHGLEYSENPFEDFERIYSTGGQSGNAGKATIPEAASIAGGEDLVGEGVDMNLHQILSVDSMSGRVREIQGERPYPSAVPTSATASHESVLDWEPEGARSSSLFYSDPQGNRLSAASKYSDEL